MATEVATFTIHGETKPFTLQDWEVVKTRMNKPDWILIIAGGLLQIPVVNAAHELGYKVLLTDRDPHCACAPLVEEFVQLDTFDIPAHVDLAQAWCGKLAAVFTAGADPIVTVAKAAEAAGCYRLPLEITQICADKAITRNALWKSKQVPQPCYTQVWCGESIVSFAEIHPSCIVKALSSSGSRGHTRGLDGVLTDLDLAHDAYHLARKYSNTRDILVEELLTGVELSVETLWHNGQMYPLNAVERPFKPDTCIELGHYNPAQLSQEDYQAVWSIMQRAGNAIGMNDASGGHILKGDLIMTDDGPKVLELTTRLSGGFDSANTSPASRGVNYIKGALRLALGQSLEQAISDFLPRWHKHSVCLALFAPRGKIINIQGIPEARALGCDVILRYEIGDDVPELIDCTQRAGFVIATDNTQELALSKAQAACGMICYEVE